MKVQTVTWYFEHMTRGKSKLGYCEAFVRLPKTQLRINANSPLRLIHVYKKQRGVCQHV